MFANLVEDEDDAVDDVDIHQLKKMKGVEDDRDDTDVDEWAKVDLTRQDLLHPHHLLHPLPPPRHEHEVLH